MGMILSMILWWLLKTYEIKFLHLSRGKSELGQLVWGLCFRNRLN
jgi:hypothetical protein